VGSSAQTSDREARRNEPHNESQEIQMSFFQEYSLLFAVAIPVAVVVLIEAVLWLSGERGASLLPGLSRYPTVMSQAQIAAHMVAAEPIAVMPEPEMRAVRAEARAGAARVAANDKVARQAA
jgi:hypothetical protein